MGFAVYVMDEKYFGKVAAAREKCYNCDMRTQSPPLTEEEAFDYLEEICPDLKVDRIRMAGKYVRADSKIIMVCTLQGHESVKTVATSRYSPRRRACGSCRKTNHKSNYETRCLEIISSNHPTFIVYSKKGTGEKAILHGYCMKCSTLQTLPIKHRNKKIFCKNCRRVENRALKTLDIVVALSITHEYFQIDKNWVFTGAPDRVLGQCLLCDSRCSPIYANLKNGHNHCTCYCSGTYNHKVMTRHLADGSANHRRAMFYILEFDIHVGPVLITACKAGIGSQKRLDEHERAGARVVVSYETSLLQAWLTEQRQLRDQIRLPNLNSHPGYPLKKGGTECWIKTGKKITVWNGQQYVDVEV